MRRLLATLILGVGATLGVHAAAQAPASEVRLARVMTPDFGSRAWSCPDSANMVFVEGEYCPDARFVCKRWLEPTWRCAEYEPAKCLSKAREHKRFCIDRDEWARPGERLPASRVSWTDAKQTCEGMGKRLCLESEWNFACEGEEMRPYPYGWKRDSEACNADRFDIYEGITPQQIFSGLKPRGILKDLRVAGPDKPRCTSSFGVRNLSGNLEEWTTLDATAKYPGREWPAMKGAWWQPSRNNCRANQIAHDTHYKGIETGFRCCANPESSRLKLEQARR